MGVSLCSPSGSETHDVAQAGLKLLATLPHLPSARLRAVKHHMGLVCNLCLRWTLRVCPPVTNYYSSAMALGQGTLFLPHSPRITKGGCHIWLF